MKQNTLPNQISYNKSSRPVSNDTHTNSSILNPIKSKAILSKSIVTNFKQDYENLKRLTKSQLQSLSQNINSDRKKEGVQKNHIKNKLSENNGNQTTIDTDDTSNLNNSVNLALKSILKNSTFHQKKSITERLTFSQKEIEEYINEYSTTFKKKHHKHHLKNVAFQEKSNFSALELNQINEALELYEEFLILNENFIKLMNNVRISKYCDYYCSELWNYFNFSNLKERYDELYKGEKLAAYKDAVILESLSLILIYDVYRYSSTKNIITSLYKLTSLIYQNFLININSYTNFFAQTNPQFARINSIILEKVHENLKSYDKSALRNNNSEIFRILKEILETYPRKIITETYIEFLSNIRQVNLADVDEFFKKAICVSDNLLYDEVDIDVYKAFKQNRIQIPFIQTKQTKEYSLILDLEDTLVNLKYNNNPSATLNLRPGLFKFLDEIADYFELIIFSTGTPDFSDPIINAIESKRNYFCHKFYKGHNSVEKNEYFKDLSLLGRDPSKIIIVDNIPKTFKHFRDNGIYIKSYSPETDPNDHALNSLLSILKKIVQAKPEDIRKELHKFKKQLAKSVSIGL